MIEKSAQAGRYSRNKKQTKKRIAAKNKAYEYLEESDLQKDCENYLDGLNLRYIHIPNRTTRTKWQAKACKDVPDLIIFEPNSCRDYPRCIIVELKLDYNKPTPGQEEWLHDVYGQELPEHAVCKDYDKFIMYVNEFLTFCRDEKPKLKEKMSKINHPLLSQM